MTTTRVSSRSERRASSVYPALLLALSFILLLGATGCKKDPAKPLHGTWSLDRDAWLAQDFDSDMSEDEQAVVEALIESMQFALRFNKDGSYEFYSLVFADEELSEGRYDVLSVEHGEIALEITNPDGEVKVGEATLHGPDRVSVNVGSTPSARMSNEGPEKLPFKRISEEEFAQYVASANSNTVQDSEAEAQDMAAHERAKKAGAQRLTGSWLLDSAATIAQLPKGDHETAIEFMRLVRIGIVFNPDKTLEMHVAMMGERDFQGGSYTILEAEPDRLAIKLVRDDEVDEDGTPIEDEPSTMVVAFLENDRMVFRPAEMEGQTQADLAEETLILKRVTKSELHDALNNSGEKPSGE